MTRTAAALLALATAIPAMAATPAWQSVAAKSRLNWIARFQGTPVHGSFPRFNVTARLDPASPAGGSLEVTVDTSAARTASADVTRAIRSPQWFNVSAHPKAQFQGTLKRSHGRLQARGTLRLKGTAQSIQFPIAVQRVNGDVHLSGRFQLDRGDFDIGAGKWRSGEMIARQVTVTFSVLLAPSG